MRPSSFIWIVAFLICLLGCSSSQEVEPDGPIARIGSTPTIDGIFSKGEWDDAQVIQVSQADSFCIKHDRTHLYFAFTQDGGNIYLNTEKGIRVLHASAQLGDAEYLNSDSLRLTLDKAFDWQLHGLQNEMASSVKKTITDYLVTSGWVASTGPLGSFAQAEWAISFDMLGIAESSKRYVKTPGLFLFVARMRLSPEEKEAFMTLTPEERKVRYPPLVWPAPPVPDDSLNNGYSPESITVDPTGWSNIWIDFKGMVPGTKY